MAASGTDLDDMVVCLMSMGFDIKDCQDAIQFGKVTVESAVNWILGGKPGQGELKPVTQSGPSLRLRNDQSNFETSPNSSVAPIPAQSEVSAAAQTSSQSASSTEESNQSDQQVVSRLHMNDEQRKVKSSFETKQREEAKKIAVLEKKRHREDHARILKEIAEDREKKRMTHPAPAKLPRSGEGTESGGTKSGTGHTVGTTSSGSTAAPSTSSSCLLQIRLPDGRSVRHSFAATATLHEVWNFTSTECPTMAGFTFIQPFPHHEFTEEEMVSSLTDLKLTPTGSLVLQKKQVSQAMTEAVCALEVDDEDKEASPAKAPSLVHNANPRHRWGQGQAMDTSETEGPPAVDAAAGEEMEEEGEREGDDIGPDQVVVPGFQGGGLPQGLLQGVQGLPGMPQMGHQIGQGLNMAGGADMFGGGQQGPGVFAGVGQRMVPEGHPDQSDQHHLRSVREVALERAQARLDQPVDPRDRAGPSTKSIHTTQTVPSLQLCCLRIITRGLNDPRNQILSLSGLSEDLGQLILTHMLKEKQLRPKTLNAFIPCYLRRLMLDCYPYTTNELLNSVRLHTHLQHLSLQSCPTITDAGVQNLNSLKKLKSLNLSSCKQLSNKCVPVLTCLTSLVSLNIEDTGISDVGVIQLMSTRPVNLFHLNLNRTAVTHAIIPHLKAATGLKSLQLEGTKVVSLLGIQELLQLEVLNIAQTGIVTESFLCISNHPNLISINIASTDNVVGDEALRHLSGLKLQSITLPSRHTTTSSGMIFLAGLPLTSLDLTNYINVGDEGIEHIGKMRTIKKLLLSTTKITDQGMLFLAGMRQLEVLNLDRTAITNQGAEVIRNFTNLLDLSLASTSVSSRFLLSGGLNNCVHLNKLNLSRTRVTNRGVKSLQLPSLVLLSLDITRVDPDIKEVLMNQCTCLTQVSLRSLEPVSRDDDVEDEEMMNG